MKMLRKHTAVWVLFVFSTICLHAQKIGIKNNLLYDATTTLNLGVEFGISKKTTAQLFYGFNPWKFHNSDNTVKQLRHWVLVPEFRYWFCEKFNGHFLGVHVLGGQYNLSNMHIPNPFFKNLGSRRYEGWFLGGGVTYGYQWMLSRHWNLEASIGAGYIRFHQKEFDCQVCAPQLNKRNKNYFGPTKLALSIMYVF